MMTRLRLDLQFSQVKNRKSNAEKGGIHVKGQVAKSTDVNTAISFLLIFYHSFYWAFYEERIIALIERFYSTTMLMKVSTSNIHQLFLELLQETGLLLMPILGVGMLAGIISNYLQVGFLFSPEVIKPKLEKLDPIKGFKRIYSIRALVELLKSILKIGFVGLRHLLLFGCTLTKFCGFLY